MSKTYTGATPQWLSDVISQLSPPTAGAITNPADTAEVLRKLNMGSCTFDHEDGPVTMAYYIPCTDPDTGHGVGLAVMYMPDEVCMFRRALSIQGAHLEDAATEVLEDYINIFNKPGIEASEQFNKEWEADEYQLISTGGGLYARAKTIRGIQFWLTNEAQDQNINPLEPLVIGAYEPQSGEWLSFHSDADNKAAAESMLDDWAETLQDALQEALALNAMTSKSVPRFG